MLGVVVQVWLALTVVTAGLLLLVTAVQAAWRALRRLRPGPLLDVTDAALVLGSDYVRPPVPH